MLYFAEEKCVIFGNSIRPDVMYFAGETCKLNGPLRGGASLSRLATRPAGAAPGAGSKEGDHPTIDIYIASDRFRVQLLTVGLAGARPNYPSMTKHNTQRGEESTHKRDDRGHKKEESRET